MTEYRWSVLETRENLETVLSKTAWRRGGEMDTTIYPMDPVWSEWNGMEWTAQLGLVMMLIESKREKKNQKQKFTLIVKYCSNGRYHHHHHYARCVRAGKVHRSICVCSTSCVGGRLKREREWAFLYSSSSSSSFDDARVRFRIPESKNQKKSKTTPAHPSLGWALKIERRSYIWSVYFIISRYSSSSNGWWIPTGTYAHSPLPSFRFSSRRTIIDLDWSKEDSSSSVSIIE